MKLACLVHGHIVIHDKGGTLWPKGRGHCLCCHQPLRFKTDGWRPYRWVRA